MRHFRSIVLIFAVLLQALPGAVGRRAMTMTTAEHTPKCTMDCCAWIQEQEQREANSSATTDTCACAPTSEQQQQPTAPPTIPSQSTRDVIPVVYWKAQEEVLQPAAPLNEPQSGFVMTDASEQATPHVRLSVLFCAILI